MCRASRGFFGGLNKAGLGSLQEKKRPQAPEVFNPLPMNSTEYAEKLKDPRWQKKRLEIFERDGWTCKYCGSKEKTLCVHHLFYFKGKNPWEIENGFLLTLCQDCHCPKDECELGLCGECGLSKKEGGECLGVGGGPPQYFLEEIGGLLDEIWTSGYTYHDLVLIKKAIFYEKRNQAKGLIDMELKNTYRDFINAKPNNQGIDMDFAQP